MKVHWFYLNSKLKREARRSMGRTFRNSSESGGEIVVPGRRTGRRRIHINMLKQWKQPEADIFHVVVAEEDAEEVIEPTRLADPDLTEEQNRQLDDIGQVYGCSVHKNREG